MILTLHRNFCTCAANGVSQWSRDLGGLFYFVCDFRRDSICVTRLVSCFVHYCAKSTAAVAVDADTTLEERQRKQRAKVSPDVKRAAAPCTARTTRIVVRHLTPVSTSDAISFCVAAPVVALFVCSYEQHSRLVIRPRYQGGNQEPGARLGPEPRSPRCHTANAASGRIGKVSFRKIRSLHFRRVPIARSVTQNTGLPNGVPGEICGANCKKCTVNTTHPRVSCTVWPHMRHCSPQPAAAMPSVTSRTPLVLCL